jgi:recombination protein RecT
MKPEMARALPKHMDADRMARIALTVLRQTPALARCTSDSFLGALMTCSQLGLEPGPMGQAYLVPYGDTVTFIPGYKGLIDLAWRSGRVLDISAETVYANDHFYFRKGLDPKLEHDWSLTDERGAAVGWYAAAKLKDGGSAFVVMSRSDVEKIRERSRAKNNGPWKTDYEAMAKKTCIRQLAKFLPLSVEFAQAVAQDGAVRTDITPDAVDAPAVIEAEAIDSPTADDLDIDPDTGEVIGKLSGDA